MKKTLSRRDFLKLGALGISSLAFRRIHDFGELADSENIVRVAIDASESVSVYSQPDDKSTIKFQRYRDEIVNVYYEVISDKSPEYNPLWYRVWGGYIHCAHMQRVHVKINPVPEKLGEGIHPVRSPSRFLRVTCSENRESGHRSIACITGPFTG